MTPYHAQHADLFRAVAEILARDYIAPSKTADTVAEWCEKVSRNNDPSLPELEQSNREALAAHSPQGLAALIADVEGYEKR